MQNIFTDYPVVLWKPGWQFFAEPGDPCPLITGNKTGELTAPESTWSLQLLDPAFPVETRLLSNGLSLCDRKRKSSKQIQALLLEPGVLTGSFSGFPAPLLSAPEAETLEPNLTWVKSDPVNALLLCKESRFALVTGSIPKDLALLKAEAALEEDFDRLREEETRKRLATAALFSINPRHNPPVALAAESLRQRLRKRTAALHGTWSTTDGPGPEAFSLNELYPLVQSWCLIEPETALALVQTALSLQQSTGGFPAWVDAHGATSSAAPWPLITQSFELAIKTQPSPTLLKKSLPALRKYMQWALRRFDPHRDLIPSWQSAQEVFIPNSFERGKSTPDMTVMLINELEALLRLCEKMDHSETAAGALTIEHDQLTRTLTTVFWNPETKAFSNVWKDGHTIHEPSFASFMPLLWPPLPDNFKTPLLETFEETHGFPGQANAAAREKEKMDETADLPVIHQFMALQALRTADTGRALLMLFVRRIREGSATWFERKSIEAARHQDHNDQKEEAAYALGPVTAALLINAQYEFQHEAREQAPVRKNLQRIVHRMRFAVTDLKIVLYTAVAMLIVHLLYTPAARLNEKNHMAEAALNYRQGQFSEALSICRRYPDNALSLFIRANLMMLTENPDQAESFYYEALLKETESPSALFGYALSLQMNGKFADALQRYNDFLDIHEAALRQGANAEMVQSAYEFMRLADNGFRKPPRWKEVYTHPIMKDLGL